MVIVKWCLLCKNRILALFGVLGGVGDGVVGGVGDGVVGVVGATFYSYQL